MNIIKKLRKDLGIQRSWRTYFDSGSYEFERTDYEEKVQTLKRIITSGYRLELVLAHYKENYSIPGYEHVISNLKRTLIFLISYLRTGESIDAFIIENMIVLPEDTVIEALEKELLKD